VYLFLCGFHVGINAPTNEAVDVFINALIEAFPPHLYEDLEIIRIYPSSRESMGASRNEQSGQDDDMTVSVAASKVSDLDMIRYMLDDAANKKSHAFSGRDYSLQKRVLQKAASGKHTCYAYFSNEGSQESALDEPPVNMYAALQGFVELSSKVPVGDWSHQEWTRCKTVDDPSSLTDVGLTTTSGF